MPRNTKKRRQLKSKFRLKLFRIDSTCTEYDTTYVWAENKEDAENRADGYMAPYDNLDTEEVDTEEMIVCADEAINQDCEPEVCHDEKK